MRPTPHGRWLTVLLAIAPATLPAETGRDRSRAVTCSEGVFLVSAVAVLGSAFIDIVTAPVSAVRYNRRRLAIAPRIDVPNRSYGLSLSWSFGRAQSAPVKSPGAAFAWSFFSTGVPMLLAATAGDEAGAWLFLTGLVVGPSVGQLYAAQYNRAFGTIVLRGVGSAVGIASIVACFD